MWSDKQYATKISPIGAGDGVHELIWPCCSSGGLGDQVTGPILCKCDASTDMQTCGGAAPGPRATLVSFSYYYLKCMKISNRFLMKQINRSAKMEWNKWMNITNFWVRGSPMTCAISLPVTGARLGAGSHYLRLNDNIVFFVSIKDTLDMFQP